MGFHSNGNTHHDIGMIEISRGQDRFGRDGTLQIPKTRGTTVGLSHLGWEMENERDVVEAYKRARALGHGDYRTADHIISHSVYVPDPDGNMHEFYADVLEDWRSVFNLELEDEVTAVWDPLSSTPSEARNYPVDPPIRSVPSAPLRLLRITDATLATGDLDRLVDFFTDVAGLTPKDKSSGEVVFSGSAGGHDLRIVTSESGGKLGLQAFAFAVTDDCDISAAAKTLSDKGIATSLSKTAQGSVLSLTDPDGFRITFSKVPN